MCLFCLYHHSYCIVMIYMPLFFKVESLALELSHHCTSSTEVTWKDMDKIFWYQIIKTQQNSNCTHISRDVPFIRNVWYFHYIFYWFCLQSYEIPQHRLSSLMTRQSIKTGVKLVNNRYNSPSIVLYVTFHKFVRIYIQWEREIEDIMTYKSR